MPADTDTTVAFDEELAGLDALETADRAPATRRATRAWSALWPKLTAIVTVLAVWQTLVWTNWKPSYAFPGPGKVLSTLWDTIGGELFWRAVANTLRRALVGFAISLVVGTLIGVAVARSRILRRAIGSLITGLQTMPSICWFPLAILLFQLTEAAILFVVVLGAAPSIANGLINGVDHIPPLLMRAGKVLGARGISMLRSVILPAALPSYVGGLKQGWAFAWRSLMAGELLVIIGNTPSLGVRMDFARQLSDAPLLMTYMIVILTIGIIVDAVFSRIEHRVRDRRGLLTDT